MIYLGRESNPMLVHAVEVARDAMLVHSGYTQEDWDTLDKLKELEGPSLVVTGKDVTDTEARQMLRGIVEAEMRNWVPGASQRLIARASRALGLGNLLVGDEPRQADHGPDIASHVIVADWIAGLYLRRCVTCLRLFPDGAPQTSSDA